MEELWPGQSIFHLNYGELIGLLGPMVEAGYEDLPHWQMEKEGYSIIISPNTDKKRVLYSTRAYTSFGYQDAWERYGAILNQDCVQDVVAGLKAEDFQIRYSRCFVGNRAAVHILSFYKPEDNPYFSVRIKGFDRQPVRDIILAVKEAVAQDKRVGIAKDRTPFIREGSKLTEPSSRKQSVTKSNPKERYWKRPLSEVRDIALQAPLTEVPAQQARRTTYRRTQAVRVYILRRADGICEGCGNPAPFTTAEGRPYLEPHHTRKLSDRGYDHPAWIVAVCPNCHRQAHHAGDAEAFNARLTEIAHAKENAGG